MSEPGNGEFRGATIAEIGHIKEDLSGIRRTLTHMDSRLRGLEVRVYVIVTILAFVSGNAAAILKALAGH